jgi:hypothetical protein
MMVLVVEEERRVMAEAVEGAEQVAVEGAEQAVVDETEQIRVAVQEQAHQQICLVPYL